MSKSKLFKVIGAFCVSLVLVILSFVNMYSYTKEVPVLDEATFQVLDVKQVTSWFSLFSVSVGNALSMSGFIFYLLILVSPTVVAIISLFVESKKLNMFTLYFTIFAIAAFCIASFFVSM